MLLIATDEAGYGPKLGPLVICATAWKLPNGAAESDSASFFAAMSEQRDVGGIPVVVNDSKQVFKPKSASKSAASSDQATPDNLVGLHRTVSIANRLREQSAGKIAGDFSTWVRSVAGQDTEAILQTPWLNKQPTIEFDLGDEIDEVVDHWSQSNLELHGVSMRIIPAAKFNAMCASGMNKADVLSESTLGLVRELIDAESSDSETVRVFCDRHGGRRYYAGVIQHVFENSAVQVIDETKIESAYRIASGDLDTTIRFTVKGDAFTPVAMSSLYAKYVRERMMQTFNQYFAERHRGEPPLKETAGYPVDADRFLRDVRSIVEAENIAESDLIRQR